MVLVPVLGLGLSWVFFGESVHPVSALGVGLVLIGVGVAASAPEAPAPVAQWPAVRSVMRSPDVPGS